jgi:NDP-sugar pyrophosphorylase family protein
MQVHRDIMDGRYSAPPFGGRPGVAWVSPAAQVDPGARLEGPLFIDAGCVIKAGAQVGPHTVLGEGCRVDEEATVSGAIVWPHSHIGRAAEVRDVIVGYGCRIGDHARIVRGMIGDRSEIAEYSQL